MVSDPEVRRYLPPGPPPTRETYDAALTRRHALEAERGFAILAVERKADGQFVGQSGLTLLEGTGPEIEIAYHFIPPAWGKGYASEAARAVLDHAFTAVGLDRVIGVVMPANIGSWRVLEKAGMRYDGLATYYNIENVKKYVATRNEWRRISS